ncbi:MULTISPECIES: DUF3140 domain-containing protein [Actinomadura]|uniref:DUF3140 domain-containing protein n=1 Tax=Actinomadura yumaensis TaxID=111807 RepID=A0ABW2D261_9ACTN|nr:DUF3140 domain-containing protein [Actinomadura sp. J1-007]MWK35511.1 DUF3140 domain-containing protein [Actinomadura sp. J1-007]
MTEPTPADAELVWDEFHQVVNMTSDELRTWLLTEASGEEAFPAEPDMRLPELGTRVVDLLRKRKVDLTPRDADVMRQVVEYVEDRLDDRPPQAVQNEDWRHSLMNVGHDPLKP